MAVPAEMTDVPYSIEALLGAKDQEGRVVVYAQETSDKPPGGFFLLSILHVMDWKTEAQREAACPDTRAWLIE